jgi:hypothetical protein
LVLLIKIYSTDISTQKDANTLSICLIGFTYSHIHQSRHNFVFFRNYCTGGRLKETGVRALSLTICIFHIPTDNFHSGGGGHRLCLAWPLLFFALKMILQFKAYYLRDFGSVHYFIYNFENNARMHAPL